MNSKDYQFLIGVGILLLLGLLFFAGRMFLTNSADEKGVLQEQGELEKDIKPSESSQDPPGGGTVRVLEDAGGGGVVEYTDGGFGTHALTVTRRGDVTECMVTILNKSLKTLTIRLSPYDPVKVVGHLYDDIQPGGSMILDPRFRVPRIAFHDRREPRNEFSVTLGEGCSEF